MMETSSQDNWTEIISPKTNLFDLRLNELWRYRDLVMMFVKRDFVFNYKQTILGPLWFLIQPLITTFTYFIMFGKAAGLAPTNIPPILFYMSGVTIWSYFSECLTKTATVFKDNAQMFGKVYFPRLTMPFSIVISNLIRFGIQFGLFLLIWIYYLLKSNSGVHPNIPLLFITPFLVIVMGVLALGSGMIVSSLTTKYKDLIFLMTFGVQLLMFATPIIIPLEKIPEKYKWIIMANPISPIVETFRYAYTGAGILNWWNLLYSLVFAMVILFFGAIVFNKVEKSFTDVV
jgi:lipopolysaccharide transport system permease protein